MKVNKKTEFMYSLEQKISILKGICIFYYYNINKQLLSKELFCYNKNFNTTTL